MARLVCTVAGSGAGGTRPACWLHRAPPPPTAREVTARKIVALIVPPQDRAVYG